MRLTAAHYGSSSLTHIGDNGFRMQHGSTGGGGGPVAPSPYNNSFIIAGDSRTAAGEVNTNATGTGAFTINSAIGIGRYFGSYLESLTYGKVIAINQRLIDFGIGSQTSGNIVTVPRPTTPQKSIDVMARSPAGVVILLMGTNDTAVSVAAADPGKGNGAVSSVNSRSNVRYLVEYLTDPVRNAAINSALGIDGGVCNLYGGAAKTVILINELPRGRYIANGGTTTLASPHADQAAMYQFSRWLLSLDYAQAGGYSNVVVVNGYDALVDYTTVPDGVAGRPAGAPAFGGGSTANADTYLPDEGAFYDGLHPSAYGCYKVGKAAADRIDAIWTTPGFLTSLYPGSAADYSTQNENFAAMAGSAPVGFLSVTGSVPTGVTIQGTNVSDIALTLSTRTDIDGQTVLRVQGSGTSTGTASKLVQIGHSLTPTGYATGVHGPALAKGDKARYYAKARILSANKLNGFGISASIAGSDNQYIAEGKAMESGGTVWRVYLQDNLEGVDAGISEFVPIISRVTDMTPLLGNSATANNGFGNMQAFINASFLSNATDAPIGTALAFDFEIKGVGLLETTGNEPGYNVTATLLDYFTDTDGTLLTAHTAGSGAWSLVTGYTDTAAITTNRVRSNTTGFAAWENSTVPTSDNYSVWARMRRLTGVNGAGVAARIQSGAATYYAAVYDAAAGNIVLSRYVAGTPTVLATTAVTIADATDFTLALEVDTITSAQVQLRVLRNGVQVGTDFVDVSADRILTRGKSGITLQGSTSTTGIHVDTVILYNQ